MQQSFRLGRIAGVEIGANWSLLVIAWLLTWGLAAGALPEAAPGHATGVYGVVAFSAAALFFVSLLTHELAHSIVARRHGVPVAGITLWLFGGVSRLEGDLPDARSELHMAVVGPAASLGLALVYAALALAAAPVDRLDLAVAALTWLAVINGLLGLFNLLPAFPLDGGRVLRALLWSRRGDRRAATLTAARVGQGFGYALIGVGLLFVAGGFLLDALWFVFLGWFLLGAAQSEAAAVVQQDLLGGVLVGDAMGSPPVVVPAWITLVDLMDDHVLRARHSSFPVVDGTGMVVGLVTLDRVRLVPAERRAFTSVGAAAFTLAEVPRARPDEPLLAVLPRLAGSPAGRALVFDGDRLVGVLSRTDVTRTLELADLRPVATGPGRSHEPPARAA